MSTRITFCPTFVTVKLPVGIGPPETVFVAIWCKSATTRDAAAKIRRYAQEIDFALALFIGRTSWRIVEHRDSQSVSPERKQQRESENAPIHHLSNSLSMVCLIENLAEFSPGCLDTSNSPTHCMDTDSLAGFREFLAGNNPQKAISTVASPRIHELGKRMNGLPERMEIPQSTVKATRLDGGQFEMNLFDPTPDDSMNSLERGVASFLEEQSPLYFWYRNIPQRGYYVQGWQKSRIYADFIFTTNGGKKPDYRKVFVLETKGLHLKNENTKYKKSVFDLCNKHAKRKTWNELVPAMRDKEITYEVVFQNEWEKRLNELLA